MTIRFMFLLALLVYFFSPMSWAVDAIELKPMYDADSHIPDVLIPYRVEGTALVKGKVTELETLSDGTAICRAMRDPYASKIVLLKCDGEADVSVRVTVKDNGHLMRLTYGPLKIRKPATQLVVIKQPPTDPQVLAGRQLFNTYCVDCHKDPTSKAPRTGAQIKTAVFGRAEMAPLRKILKDPDYQKLEAYLKSL